jgi:hypothetical protein
VALIDGAVSTRLTNYQMIMFRERENGHLEDGEYSRFDGVGMTLDGHMSVKAESG